MHKRGFQKTQILSQCEKVRNKDRRLLLFQDKERFVDNNVVPLVLNFHPALSGISQKVKSLWPVLHASDDMNKVFKNIKPLISFRRPRNLADNLVRSRIKEASNTREDKGMKKCGKSRCQICSYVEEAEEFEYGNKKYWINYPFDCDSEGVIYVIRCISCSKIYVGSTITTFRKRFNNHKSSKRKYEQGGRKMAAEHLYAHFFSPGHKGLCDVRVIIIDKTNVDRPTQREAFWGIQIRFVCTKGIKCKGF